LAALALGLVPFAVTLVQMRVFYAMKDARTPTIINAIMVAVRVPLLISSATLDEALIIPGLAVATSVSYLVGAIAGEIWLRARYGPMGTRRTLLTLLKMTVAGAAGAVAAMLVGNRLLQLEVEDLGDALVEILISGTVGLMVIAAVAVLLKVEELVPLRRRIAAIVRKVIRRGPPPGTNPPGAPGSTDAVTVALTLPSPLAGQMSPAGASAPGMSPRHGTLRGSSTSVSADDAERTVRLDTRAPRPNGPGGPDSQLDAPTEPARPREQVKGSVPSNSGGPAGRGVAEEELATPSEVTIDSPNRETGGVATGGTGADGDATRVLNAAELTSANEPPPSFADDEAGVTMPTTSSGAVGGAGSDAAVERVAAAPLTPGTTIGGRYRLVSLVSADAAGHWFWRAKDTVLPRDMAVTILPDTTGASATVARTLRAGRLHHIGLPQTLDVGTDHGQSYVVGQWVDGATLTDLLSAGPLEPDVATSITAKISEAVAEAHRNGIALGAINPSLIRVNFDGQVRFSHVIAHGSATPDQDIRAVGALLYLMLTGTWPLPEPLDPLAMAGRTVASIPPSPTSLGRELPADEVRPGVPEALSALAERALHPDEPDGIHAVGAIAALLRSPETVGHAEAATAPQDRPLSAGDRRLIRERRVKLSLAAVVLAVFAVLIVIAIGGLAKQFLASVENSAPDDVKMIDLNTPPSAQPAAPAPDAATSGGQPTPAAAPAAAPVPIVAGQVYDPQGDGKPDYKAYVDRAYDGNADSAWLTWVYKQQFPSLKTGVGLNLELEKETTPTSVQITSATPGTKVEIRSSTGPTVPLQQTTVLGSGTVTDKPLTIPLTAAPKSKYLLVFVTGMAPSADKQFQSKINEITVTGS
ncbi:MAG TPA: lipid II flippase MurJ, partial [Nakamurella sp.]|nr:lipid II flippase MurJ [Nakamurella sp.]